MEDEIENDGGRCSECGPDNVEEPDEEYDAIYFYRCLECGHVEM
ncbi:hypothetical protein [Paracidovorax konjaci]|uniref:Uncharacterized protein n=1 Tax=Paracidovorax konjaci TaxID=32040 RepID=A0A1I1VWM0_9BURK|nr:hypothetical protein [Paracidovorax konjaci]SFD87139.1 hypothetical protein SAMN04489710_107236 [Paracidovorax konjaci]